MTDDRFPKKDRAQRALILGGGGPVGRGWHMGLAAGLLDEGMDLRRADLIVGTSAGAVVGARLALGHDPREMDLAVDAAPNAAPAAAAVHGLVLMMTAMARAAVSETPEVGRAEVGAMALSADTISEDASLSRITFDTIRGQPWPVAFQATVVEALTGRFVALDARSEVPLERAVAASAALPLAWPAITLGGSRYIDGGVRSMLNADLATGCTGVIVVSCFPLDITPNVPPPIHTLNVALLSEVAGLRRDGSRVAVVEPSDALRTLTANGTRMLDPSLILEAFVLGRQHGRACASELLTAWSGDR